MQAGRRVGKVCRRRAQTRRRCRFKLARRVPVELGRPITLRARVSAQHRPIAGQPLEVWERVSVAGAEWKQVGTVQSDRRGRVRYKAPPGPARKLRFRYPGTAHVRGDNATSRSTCRPRRSIRVSRRNVINGEYVTFRGELKGRPIPAQGALVELQVRSRGKWRTFAQPRAERAGRVALPVPLRDRQRRRPLPLPRARAPAGRLPVRDRQLEARSRVRVHGL